MKMRIIALVAIMLLALGMTKVKSGVSTKYTKNSGIALEKEETLEPEESLGQEWGLETEESTDQERALGHEKSSGQEWGLETEESTEREWGLGHEESSGRGWALETEESSDQEWGLETEESSDQERALGHEKSLGQEWGLETEESTEREWALGHEESSGRGWALETEESSDQERGLGHEESLGQEWGSEQEVQELGPAYGSAGRLFIPNVGISVALNWGSNQDICDEWDSACYFQYGSLIVVADHCHQEFAGLHGVSVGDEAYIELDGNRTYITCYEVSYGVNSGNAMYDDAGNLVYARAGYLMYTCTDNTWDVLQTWWR